MLLKEICPEVVNESKRLIQELVSGGLIGSTEAAFGVLNTISLASKKCSNLFNEYLIEWIPKFIESRPTSQVLVNILRKFLTQYLNRVKESGVKQAVKDVEKIISDIKNEVMVVKDAIASLGSKRIVSGDVILTHSHSTTVLLLLKKALENGTRFSVIVTESRPIGEGLRTAEELEALGIDTTLIVDSAVRHVMKRVSKVFVGADAVAANGAVVSKVGTSAIALAAKEARVRVYVAAETYKFSPMTVIGELVPIEIRDPTEIVSSDWIKKHPKVRIYNPVFDVTPPEYVDAIITERGVIPPQAALLILMEEYGLSIKEVMSTSATQELKEEELRE